MRRMQSILGITGTMQNGYCTAVHMPHRLLLPWDDRKYKKRTTAISRLVLGNTAYILGASTGFHIQARASNLGWMR